MATMAFISNSRSPSPPLSTRFHKISASASTLSFPSTSTSRKLILELGSQKMKKNGRGFTLVTRAGPNTSSYIFAVVFPLALLLVTIFSALKVDDIVERKFLEELAINEEIMEAEEIEGESNSVEGKTEVPRTRNRPKREIEVSSK